MAESLCMCVCVGGGGGACVCVRGHISSLISLPSSDGSEKLSCIFTHDIDASVLEFAWSFKHDFLRAEMNCMIHTHSFIDYISYEKLA